ncbi:unnamed protein product [Microthlaspi erraticum]|uniref:Uncharacterized protein n=1 Tax=Microthlaspi erraticum TaxID=1685480 RepID=A0A6D2J8W9_9BRAS|nr:unnamed protein product [Microthlaspi erraticum]
MPNNEEDNQPEQLEDYVGMEDLEKDGSNDSSDIAMTPFELMQRCEKSKNKKPSGCGPPHLTLTPSLRSHLSTVTSSSSITALDLLHSISPLYRSRRHLKLTQIVNPMDEEVAFEEYGSFMDFDVLEGLQSEPSKKKAKLSGDKEAASGSQSKGNNEADYS